METAAKTTLEWLQDRSTNPKLTPWRRSVERPEDGSRRFPSNLMGLERICQEEWDKPLKSTWEKLVETKPRRFRAVTAAKWTKSRA